jgi:hypothetical protein
MRVQKKAIIPRRDLRSKRIIISQIKADKENHFVKG